MCRSLVSAISVLKRILNHPVSFPELCYKYKEAAAVSNAMNICSVIIYKLIIYWSLYTWVGTVFSLSSFHYFHSYWENSCWIWFMNSGAFLQQETVIVRVSHMVVVLSCLHISSVEYQSLAVYVKKSLSSFSLVGGFYPGFYFSVFHSIFKKSQVFFFFLLMY